MNRIKLTQGKFAVVDDEDYEYLNQFKWYCNAQNYAVREQTIGKNKTCMLRMSRVVNETPDGLDCDHIDGDTLNNTKSNLRNIPHSKNMFNLRVSKNNKSGYSGVSWHKETGKWRAYINLKGKQISLGFYESIQEAVNARKAAKEKYHAI